MKKNIQNKLDELKGNFVTLLPSNKLKAAILATMALALAACDNGAGGTDNPYVPPYEEESPNPPDTEDPTKDVASRTLNSISATHNGTSAKSLDDILDNTTFTINYNVIYTDGTTDTNITEKVGYTKLRQYFNEDVVSFSVNGDFSETNQTVDLIITYNDKQFTLSGIKNGNYKDPTNPSAKTVVELLKDILGAEYNTISENVSSGNITLTAEKIKAVGDFFPALEKDAESGKDAKDVENVDVILQNKEAFVAQARGEMEDVFKTIYPEGYEEHPFLFDEDDFERKYVVTYKKNFTFEGEFNLDEIDIIKADGAQGDFSNVILTNGGSKILIDKLNDIRGSSLPTLLFNNTNNISDDSSAKETYYLYKAYSDTKNLDKLQLKGDLYYDPIDGKKISGDSNYTLFEDNGNTAKSADNETIKSLTVDTLVQMTKQLNIYKFYNMIISGDATKNDTVNWELKNIVFEGDMSKIINNFRNPDDRACPLYGIVYFKDKPYNNNNGTVGGQSIRGMLKLDNLEGVSSENFQIGLSYVGMSVFDISGVGTSFLNTYNPKNKEIIVNGGHTHAIYFSKDYNSYKNEQDKIDELCGKFFPADNSGIVNAYLGDTKVKGTEFYTAPDGYFTAASKNPRTLKEFEDLGNTYDADHNYYMQFKKSAKESYTLDEFEELDEREKKSLDEDDNRLAKNDRRIEFIDPETQKIIFSVVNDRQYNA